jgi:transposase
VGIAHLRRALPGWLEDVENGLTDAFRVLLSGLAEDLRELDDRIVGLDEWIAQTVRADPVAQRLVALRGIGPLTASALEAHWGTVERFREVVTLRCPSDLRRANTARAERTGYWESPSGATPISESSWCMVLAQ